MNKYKTIFKKNILMMMILIIVLGLSFWFLDLVQRNKHINKIPLGGGFVLTNQNGEIFDSKKIKKKKLIYFGYTFCPDVCPFDILRISKVFENNPSLIEQIQPIFITVDPERDTPENLRSFLENFSSDIIGLTGNNEQIKEVIKKFKIYVKYNKSSELDSNYLVDHSSLVFLIDEKDNYLRFYRSNEFTEYKFINTLKEVL
ncbi:MAG: SCO family protein [Rickettsiales bacterium]|nr:SCO family protein [Rickettsiales bacterium]|tara:strand:+ start:511 stop:1113 length:603 start_codon:yes stop_codon:yes gene_type:complete